MSVDVCEDLDKKEQSFLLVQIAFDWLGKIKRMSKEITEAEAKKGARDNGWQIDSNLKWIRDENGEPVRQQNKVLLNPLYNRDTRRHEKYQRNNLGELITRRVKNPKTGKTEERRVWNPYWFASMLFLSDADLRKLALSAGGMTFQREGARNVFDDLRRAADQYARQLIEEAAKFAELANRKTVMDQDLYFAVEQVKRQKFTAC